MMLRIAGGALLLVWLALQTWTQWLAYHYGYHALLGAPWWHVQAFYGRHSIYAPWQGLVWTALWGSTGRKLWVLGGIVGLGLVVLLAAWSAARQRRLHPPPMTGHGTTQWATRRDMKKAGLL